jgi:ATP-dependent helicase/nuclease subunit A
MVLSDQLPIMDLVALGHFLLLPNDDLTLATVLKGPLIGFDEELLFDLAYDRGKTTLWRRLGERAGEDPRCRDALDLLAGLRARVDFTPPHELYAEILGSLGGRRAMVARMGEQANDPLDEFLTLALSHERAHTPSLQGFLRWFAEGRTEVKRDLEQTGRDEVRVMTVHGAKGLQAPVVILADTMATPGQSPRLLWSDDAANLPFWAPRRDDEDTTLTFMRADANAARDREYRRLLYVAMTRAEDRLVVCGHETQRAPPDDCWYELVRRGLAEVAETIEFDLPGTDDEEWSGEGLRLASPQTVDGADRDARDDADAAALEPLPSWASAPAPSEPIPPRPLVPSRLGGDEPGPLSPLDGDGGAALRRGVLIHRLLQSLPEVAPERRADAASRYLAQPVHGLGADDRASIAAETLAIFAQPDFAPLFGPGSRGEVPIVGRIGGTVVSGRVDRLAVSDDEVLIVDYKSGRAPPDDVADVPPVYLAQLAAYRSVLAEIYPGREIRAALLWTALPRLMPIEPALLEAT